MNADLLGKHIIILYQELLLRFYINPTHNWMKYVTEMPFSQTQHENFRCTYTVAAVSFAILENFPPQGTSHDALSFKRFWRPLGREACFSEQSPGLLQIYFWGMTLRDATSGHGDSFQICISFFLICQGVLLST